MKTSWTTYKGDNSVDIAANHREFNIKVNELYNEVAGDLKTKNYTDLFNPMEERVTSNKALVDKRLIDLPMLKLTPEQKQDRCIMACLAERTSICDN